MTLRTGPKNWIKIRLPEKHQFSNNKNIIKIGPSSRKFWGGKHKKDTVKLRTFFYLQSVSKESNGTNVRALLCSSTSAGSRARSPCAGGSARAPGAPASACHCARALCTAFSTLWQHVPPYTSLYILWFTNNCSSLYIIVKINF